MTGARAPEGFLANLLQGKTALVTGAGRGNGRFIAEALASVGAAVCVTDIDGSAALAAASRISSNGAQAVGFELDVTEAGDCQRVVAAAREELGDISILVNNAGIIVRAPSDAADGAANFRRTMDVNLNGAFNATMACLSDLRRTRGNIVNIVSLTSFIGHVASGYSPSKGALQQLTRSHALEFGSQGIRVNAVAPGVIATDMTVATLSDQGAARERLLGRIPLGAFGEPGDIANSVVFLASDLAAYVSGATLLVDGGFMTS